MIGRFPWGTNGEGPIAVTVAEFGNVDQSHVEVSETFMPGTPEFFGPFGECGLKTETDESFMDLIVSQVEYVPGPD